MSKKIVSFDEAAIKKDLGELVRQTVEETLNAMILEEADRMVDAVRYERTEARKGYRSGSYERGLTTTAGKVTLSVPKLKGLTFQTAIIECYQRRESSVEEAIIEMYPAGVSERRVNDITEILWDEKISASTVSTLNKKVYPKIEKWRTRPLSGEYPYVYVDGIFLKRAWGGSYENVSVLVAIGANEQGNREIIGCATGMKEDKASWHEFFCHLKERGLIGVRLIIGDKSLGMLGAAEEVFPEAKYQRCVVHFYRNVFSKTPPKRRKEVARMLKAIHARENKDAARNKAQAIIERLEFMKLGEAARVIRDGIEETLTYMDRPFPVEHWVRIRTDNGLERLNKEIRRRTRVVGAFPDGNSALMLVAARCEHVAESNWGSRRYLDMTRLYEMEREQEESSLEIAC